MRQLKTGDLSAKDLWGLWQMMFLHLPDIGSWGHVVMPCFIDVTNVEAFLWSQSIPDKSWTWLVLVENCEYLWSTKNCSPIDFFQLPIVPSQQHGDLLRLKWLLLDREANDVGLVQWPGNPSKCRMVKLATMQFDQFAAFKNANLLHPTWTSTQSSFLVCVGFCLFSLLVLVFISVRQFLWINSLFRSVHHLPFGWAAAIWRENWLSAEPAAGE